MNGAADMIATHDRLQHTPLGDLRARLALARTGFLYAQTAAQRAAALKEMEEIEAELKSRGYLVTA